MACAVRICNLHGMASAGGGRSWPPLGVAACLQANQRLFREMGHISRLPQLLASAIPAQGGAEGGKDSSNEADQGPGVGGLNLVTSLAGSTAAKAVMAGAGAVAAAAAGAGAVLNAHGLGGGGGGGGVVITRQKATILLCALETIQLLVGWLLVLHHPMVIWRVMLWLFMAQYHTCRWMVMYVHRSHLLRSLHQHISRARQGLGTLQLQQLPTREHSLQQGAWMPWSSCALRTEASPRW
jgi:hypothetical protein